MKSEEELVEWVNAYFKQPSLDREGRARLAKEQCEFLDGKSGERIGRFILETVEKAASSRAKRGDPAVSS